MNKYEISELVGAIIGDGNIWAKKYEIVITGDKTKDSSYFEYLTGLIKRNFGYSPHIRYREGALRLVVRSKQIFEALSCFFPNGKTAKTVKIPENVDDYAVLRGIFDTDGSIFFSKKPGICEYPAIEITTISKTLAGQLLELLQKLEFRPTIRSSKEINETFKIALNGRRQTEMWLERIGSSNKTKLEKLLLVNA